MKGAVSSCIWSFGLNGWKLYDLMTLYFRRDSLWEHAEFYVMECVILLIP